MSQPDRRVKGLAEASIRVKDLAAMQKFYEEIVGLEVLRKEEEFVFFKIAEGYGGHTQNFAIFAADETTFLRDKSSELISENSTLHHIAFNIPLEDFDAEKSRLEGLGLSVEAVDHAWVHLHSMYFPDPEGNLVEFLAYDKTL